VTLSVVRQILLIEDDAELRRMYRTALALAGFDVVEAVDGVDALRRLENDPPDLIVLEVQLPDISGIALAQEVAAHVHTCNIPVVVVTRSGQELQDLKLPPVTSVLRKPVTPEQLVMAVTKELTQRSM
jgi:two-component system chemotaxis response regulator CheY